MDKTISYKNHLIVFDGITARVYDLAVSNYIYVYKTRFIDASECLKSLKSFVNLRLDQQKRDRRINVYA